uniref:ureidoglycolate lyase n=1 Tax=Parahaliea maris TaxID=2716870 RepID=UPI001BB34300|nr:ureidoglycolate lyase [Parahaliea maris]
MRRLYAQPLTADAFAPYGDVIEASASREHFPINYGRTTRYHALAQAELSGEEDAAIISIFRSQPVALPFRAEVMERHPRGSQAFMPLSANPYLVAVAPPGPFDVNAVTLFVAAPGQGVNYRRGTWHHYSLALNGASDFLVVDRQGPGDNCDEVALEPSLEFALAPDSRLSAGEQA